MQKLKLFGALASGFLFAGHVLAADLAIVPVTTPAVAVPVVMEQKVPCVLNTVPGQCKVIATPDAATGLKVLSVEITTRSGASSLSINGLASFEAPVAVVTAPDITVVTTPGTAVAVVPATPLAGFSATQEPITVDSLVERCVVAPEVALKMLTYSNVYSNQERRHLTTYWDWKGYDWACDILRTGYGRMQNLP